jgi:hypothetical protein
MNGDDKGGAINRGPVDVIQTGGPPQEKEDKPVSIALREALMRLADIRLEINQLMRRVEKLEEQCKSQ